MRIVDLVAFASVAVADIAFAGQGWAAPASHGAPPVSTAPSLDFAGGTPLTLGQPYGPAPWWMRTPIIAATGEVQTHIFANRASFSAQFTVVDPSLDIASKQVADRVRVLAKTLQAYGAEKAQVETSLSITPIYQQYRDKQGELQTNERADKIDRYQANVRFSVTVHDLSVLERAYAAVVSARPASIQPVYFNLEPDNETNTELFNAATVDAARRAQLAVGATGARLGRVMLIDPTNRACETDVLVAGAPASLGQDAGGVQEVMVTGQRRAYAMAPPPPPPPPPPGAEPPPLFWPALRGEVIALHRLDRSADVTALLQSLIPAYPGAPDDLRAQLGEPA